MVTKIKVWKCWRGCEQDHPGMCGAHSLFPKKIFVEAPNTKRPYIAFWSRKGGRHGGFPHHDIFAIYSLIDGEFVGNLTEDGSRFVSFRGSISEPGRFGGFHKCLELRHKWVSIFSGPMSILCRSDWEIIVKRLYEKRHDYKFEENSNEAVV